MALNYVKLALSLGITAAVGLAQPAFASLASDSFKDVPDGHWAEAGIAEVAIKRDLMKGYGDGTFRGDAPFTRLQFVSSMAVLLKELEALSKVSWRPVEHPTHAFQDVPSDQADETLRLTDDYGLFEGVPGISQTRFNGEKVVTRYEMARIIHNLLRLAEAKDVVRPQGQLGEGPSFSDVDPKDWAYPDMQGVSQRYRVMVGFPDGTFRGNEELTRYQYAQAISQTVPLIRELIAQTIEIKQEEKRQSTGPWRLQEQQPIRLDGSWGNATPGGTALSLRGRLIGYPGSLFLLSETRLQAMPGFGLNQELGAMVKMPFLGPLQLQPFGGVQLYYSGPGLSTGLSGGAFLYWRPVYQWGLFGKAGVAGGLTLSQAMMNYELGAEYHLSDRWAVSGGLSSWEAPSSAGKDANVGLTIGTQFRF